MRPRRRAEGDGSHLPDQPGTVLGSLAALCAAGFVCVNALGYQTGRAIRADPAKLARRRTALTAAWPRRQGARPGGARDPVRVIDPNASPRRRPPSRRPGTRSAS